MPFNINALAYYIAFAAGLFWVGTILQFDHFSTATFTLTGIFLLLFAEHYGRYQRRIVVGREGERAVAKVLAELNVEALHDIYLPGPHGSVQIDHIALFPGSLAVLETKTYSGLLDMPLNGPWHRIGWRGRLSPIANPLGQLEAAQKRVTAYLPPTNIWGIVVLAGRHRTANGLPAQVKSLAGLRDYILYHRRKHGEWRHSKQVIDAWEILKDLQQTHVALAKTHVRDSRKRRGERFYSFEETWLLWLWGSLSVQSALLTILACYGVI